MLYEPERHRILEMCHLLQAKEYFLGTWGNVSMRVGDHIILTPSKLDYAVMRAEDMVVIDLDGNRIQGEQTATSEKEVHRQIYLVRSDVGAIIHAHTKYAMAMSVIEHAEVPCVTEEMSQLLGGAIPVTQQYVPAEQHIELGKAVANCIGSSNGVIIRNHGPVACGRSLEEALLSISVIEKSCEIYAALPYGKILTLPKTAIESEHYRYFYKYGSEKT